MQERRLLLISRDDILQATGQNQDTRLFRELARLTRSGFHLLATAPQPDHWSPSHGGPDEALLGPDSIRKRLTDAGGTLDGVYYVPRSLLTQKRNRVQALEDILRRYSVSADQCHLLSSQKNFVRVATSLGIVTELLGNGNKLMRALKRLSKITKKHEIQ
jgi:hypothetical protein